MSRAEVISSWLRRKDAREGRCSCANRCNLEAPRPRVKLVMTLAIDGNSATRNRWLICREDGPQGDLKIEQVTAFGTKPRNGLHPAAAFLLFDSLKALRVASGRCHAISSTSSIGRFSTPVPVSTSIGLRIGVAGIVEDDIQCYNDVCWIGGGDMFVVGCHMHRSELDHDYSVSLIPVDWFGYCLRVPLLDRCICKARPGLSCSSLR